MVNDRGSYASTRDTRVLECFLTRTHDTVIADALRVSERTAAHHRSPCRDIGARPASGLRYAQGDAAARTELPRVLRTPGNAPAGLVGRGLKRHGDADTGDGGELVAAPQQWDGAPVPRRDIPLLQ
jgi:hypothetical protein